MPGKRQPNTIFFFSDQRRWDTVGAYGQPLPVTPNLDRMAAEGGRFEHAFTCQPVCGPARACLQTGKYATEVGCFRNGIALPTDVPVLADLMSDAGYEGPQGVKGAFCRLRASGRPHRSRWRLARELS